MNFNKNAIPQNLEMEKQVLSAMLIRGGEKIPAVTAVLSADDFYRVEHRILFNHIVDLYARGIEPNLLSVVEELKKSGELDKIGIKYALSIGNWAFTNAYIATHAKVIKEKAELRRLIDIADIMRGDAQNGIKSVGDIIDSVSTEISAFNPSADVSKISTFKNFFVQDFKSEVAQAITYNSRKTDFENIDEHQIFSAGLYVLGATPASGKTTFAYQMAEQLARRGETCIFCSYEMSKLELFTKSVARELFMRNPRTNLSAADIRRGSWTKELDDIIADCQSVDFDLRIIELHGENINDLLKILRPICTSEGKSPVVFIDYLQIIPHSKDNTKNGIDDIVRKLKVFQRDTNTTFIVISSLNRQNYTQQISFESFKESGNIEYTADVIWGLQLNVLNKFKKFADVVSVRQKIDKAKKQQPRQIQLKCLKNRSGNVYDCFFNYFAKHDYFVPCHEKDFEDQKSSNNNEVNF